MLYSYLIINLFQIYTAIQLIFGSTISSLQVSSCPMGSQRVRHDWATELNWLSCPLLLLLSRLSCPTLCDPRDGSPPGSPVPGILQARTLEWVAISFSNIWKWKVKVKSLSRVRLFTTPWTAAYQAPPSMGFSRQEYWSRLPLPSPELSLRVRKKNPEARPNPFS